MAGGRRDRASSWGRSAEGMMGRARKYHHDNSRFDNGSGRSRSWQLCRAWSAIGNSSPALKRQVAGG